MSKNLQPSIDADYLLSKPDRFERNPIGHAERARESSSLLDRENYFVGCPPRVALTLCEQPWANFLYAFSVFEFVLISAIRVCVQTLSEPRNALALSPESAQVKLFAKTTVEHAGGN